MAQMKWETDASARRRVRDELDAIIKNARTKHCASLRKLEEAAARLSSQRKFLAQNASADLDLAALRTDDAVLKERIESLRQELDSLLYE